MTLSATAPWALVTGAGVRVGRAIALALAQRGYHLVLHAHRSRAAVDDVARAIKAMGRDVDVVLADLADDDDLDSVARLVLQRHPVLSLLVHNAAAWKEQPFASMTRAEVRTMMAINLEAPLFLTQALLPALTSSVDESGAANGAVVAIVDVIAERPIRRHLPYAMSKAALAMMVKGLALELAPLRINGVAPGAVAFPNDLDDDARRRILARVPLGREGSPDDVAEAVCFLARARYMTGQIVAVDGGRSTGL